MICEPKQAQLKMMMPFPSDITDKYLRDALKDGYIPHKDDLFLIHGPGGVGKSSLIAMFLGKQRDLVRVSTGVADESIHLCPIRNVSTLMFTSQWELVNIDRQLRMVAHTSHHLYTRKSAKDSSQRQGEEVPERKAFLAPPPPPPPPPKKNRLTKLASDCLSVLSKCFQKLVQFTEPSLMTTIKDDPDNNIESIFAEIQGVLHDLMREIRESNDLCLNYSIRVVDSGGQPQFHEIVYILLPAVTGILSVFKLSEHLDAHGDVDYYNKDGIEISDPFKSYLSNEQVIRHNILAIQSEASRGDIKNIPNLAFVGTFLDQQDACPEETPDKKDELLHSMISEILPEELQGSIISNSGSLRQVTFRVNARTPSDKDFETAGRLKVALMKQSQIKPKDLPLKWFGYEVALRKLMERFNRQTLSLHECEFIGYKLDFDQPSLKACLNYLRELHIITFYDVLPNVVFGSCQVILDKITELVIYSLKLKKGKIPVCGIERKFHQQGIISLQVLKSQDCSKHYNEHFTPDDLIKVLRSLYIIAEIKTGEYFMPCILEVSKIYPNPQLPKDTFRSSFILHFSKKIPMLGIYCCAISFLLTEAGWKFLTKGGEVVQVSRNSVTFELPRKCGGKVIFLDPLSSYLEVVVELPHIIIAEKEQRVILYREIRDTFFRAIKQALQTLHCEVMTPELTFLCHQKSSQCSTLPHIARLDDSNSFLTCSINSSSACHLTDDQKMWLPTPSKLNSSVEGKIIFCKCRH